LKIKITKLPANDLSLAVSYSNIATIHMKQADNSNALVFYRKVLAIYEHHSMTDNVQLIVLFSNLGYLHDQMECSSEAINYYEKALEIHRQHSGSGMVIEVATVYQNLGSVYSKLKDYVKALDFLRQSLPWLNNTERFRRYTMRNDP
jgi:tetratricopeptide (TPR) repeat protein